MKQPTDQEERNEDKKKPEKENPSHGIDPEPKEPEMEVDQDRGPQKARSSLSGVEDPGERQKGKSEPEKRRSASSLKWRCQGAERRFGALHLNSIVSLPFKDFTRIRDQHGLQLFVGHAFLLQRWNYIVMDM